LKERYKSRYFNTLEKRRNQMNNTEMLSENRGNFGGLFQKIEPFGSASFAESTALSRA